MIHSTRDLAIAFAASLTVVLVAFDCAWWSAIPLVVLMPWARLAEWVVEASHEVSRWHRNRKVLEEVEREEESQLIHIPR